MNQIAIAAAAPESLPFLSALYVWGLEVIRVIQHIKHPALTAIMKAVSALGTEYCYLVLILLALWCVDEKKGFRLGLLVIISGWINVTLKELFGQPRPFNFEPALGLAFEPSSGFPSGHAQTSAVFWLAAAFFFGKGKLRQFLPIFSGALILLIGFSRLYLGVHFPTDVFGGWIIAAIIFAAFLILGKPAAAFFAGGGPRLQRIAAAAAALLMNALYPADTSLSAMLLGFCVGYSLTLSRFPFTAHPPGGRTAVHHLGLRMLVGFAGAALIYAGLRYILPGTGSLVFSDSFFVPYFEISRFIRYGLLGLWASAGAPRVFMNFGIAPNTVKETSEAAEGE